MNLALESFTCAFPQFSVHISTRPGGGLLVTLKDAARELQRAIPADQIQSALHLEWIISAIRRDLALEAGVPPSIDNLQSQSRVRLPAYSYNAK